MVERSDDISPWERDDWTSSAHAPSFESLTAPVDPNVSESLSGVQQPGELRPIIDVAPADPSPTRPHGSQVWIAAAFGALLLIGGVVALVRDDTTEGRADATAEATTDGSTVSPTTSSDGRVVPSTTSGADGGVPTFWNGDAAETTVPESVGPPTIAAAVVGETPAWTEWSIPTSSPLSTMSEPTEVVAFSDDRVLHRIEFPSGRVRSLDIGALGPTAQAAVGADTIVVFTSTDLTVIRDGEPISRIPVGNGVIFVQPWPGTDRFIVTTPAPSQAGDEQELILEPDGALVPVESEPTDGNVFWARNFLPDGRFVVNRPGGVYAVGADQAAVRISGGYLLAAGSAHYAVEECDEALRCATFVVDAATRARTDAMLEALGDGFGFVDPSTRISPDGRTIVFADRSRGTGIRQLIDTATGSVLDVGAVNEVLYPDSWAADSSGIFSEESGAILFHERDTGGRVVIEGVDGVTSVATRRVPSGE